MAENQKCNVTCRRTQSNPIQSMDESNPWTSLHWLSLCHLSIRLPCSLPVVKRSAYCFIPLLTSSLFLFWSFSSWTSAHYVITSLIAIVTISHTFHLFTPNLRTRLLHRSFPRLQLSCLFSVPELPPWTNDLDGLPRPGFSVFVRSCLIFFVFWSRTIDKVGLNT